MDLGRRCGVSCETVSRLERGAVRGLTIGSLEGMADALGGTLDVTLRWHGEQLDRIADAAHAAIQASVADTLRSWGWLVEVEVSFNHYGDRGRVDLLAFHPGRRVALVVEVKSALGDLQDTLGRLDVKARLAPSLTAGAGWGECQAAVRALVIGESRTARRVVASHASLFARYAVRGRASASWLREPRQPIPTGLLWFVSLPDSHHPTVTRGQRVRSATSGR